MGASIALQTLTLVHQLLLGDLDDLHCAAREALVHAKQGGTQESNVWPQTKPTGREKSTTN